MEALSLTIPAGESISDTLPISYGLKIVRLGMPPAWTSAPLTFQFSADGTSFQDLYHAAETTEGFWPYETQIQRVIPNTNLLLPSGTGISISGFVKFRSGTAAVPVVQKEDRVFAVVVSS